MLALSERLRRERLAHREDGSMGVEMVILFPVIALVVLSILEFGHLWYVRQTLTIASREGARAAVVYQAGSDAARETWARQEAANRVNTYLSNFMSAGEWNTPIVTVTYGPSGTLTGGTLTVQVSTTNALLVLHRLTRNVSVVAQTTMRFE